MLIPFHLEELKLWNWRGFVAVGFCLLKSLEANTWPDTGRLFNLIRAASVGLKVRGRPNQDDWVSPLERLSAFPLNGRQPR